MNEQFNPMQTVNLNSNRNTFVKLLFVAIVVLIPGWFNAVAVNFISDQRSVSVGGQAPTGHAQSNGYSNTDTPSQLFIDRRLSASGSVRWDDMNGWTPAPTSSSARQDATLLPNQIGMNCVLFVNVGGDPYGVHCAPGASGTAWASSVFDVQFSISAPTQFEYTFDFDPSSTLVSANLTLALNNQTPQQFVRTSGAPISGVLAPGTYKLHYDFSSRALGAQSGYNSSSFNFNFTPVLTPEPTTFALVGLGVATLGLMQRKNRKAE